MELLVKARGKKGSRLGGLCINACAAHLYPSYELYNKKSHN